MEGVEAAIHAAVVAAAEEGEGMAAAAFSPMDILEVADPTAQMKAEMRMATKTPSEWLRLLCRDWSLENESVVAATDARFLHYKSYLRGRLTSQLLCRLSISGSADAAGGGHYHDPHDPAAVAEAVEASQRSIDFWKILGVGDEFDRAHIVANIERFCSLYNIRGGTMGDGEPPLTPPAYQAAAASNGDGGAPLAIGNNYISDVTNNPAVDPASVLAGLSSNYNCSLLYPMDAGNNAATASPLAPPGAKPSQAQAARARQAQAHRSEQRRLKAETREREREAYSVRKAAEKAARGAAREERRRRKLAMRRQREEIARTQKEAALRRAAELVRSNRVPIEITRGAAAAQAAANAAVANAAVPAAEAAAEAFPPLPPPAYAMAVVAAPAMALPARRGRSSIVISTASDLDQIVTHSNNLWAKYNAIAKEHNQKVNWIVVAKELGIHVKVREKYARMHARAKARGFDFVNWGGYRIKDYPQYFLDPLGPTASPVPPEPAKIEEPGKPEAMAGGAPLGLPQLPPAFSLPLSPEGVGGAPAAEAIQQQQHAAENPLSAEAVGPLGSANPLAGLASEAAAMGPVNPMVSLAAEAAGVVGGGAGFSSDQAVIAAAAAVQGQHHQLHQPPDVSDEDMTHVIPALPPAPAPGVDDLRDLRRGGMKGAVDDMPNLGSSTAV